jgi:hypothetical protein
MTALKPSERFATRYRDGMNQVWDFSQVDDVAVAKVTLPKIEDRKIAHHQEETLVERLIEAKLLFELRDEFRRESLSAAIGLPPTARSPRRAGRHLGWSEFTTLPRNTRRCRYRGVIEPGKNLLDRPTRHDLHDEKVQQHDDEQRRDDQQQPPDDVSAHRITVRCRRSRDSGGQPSLRRTTTCWARPRGPA